MRFINWSKQLVRNSHSQFHRHVQSSEVFTAFTRATGQIMENGVYRKVHEPPTSFSDHLLRRCRGASWRETAGNYRKDDGIEERRIRMIKWTVDEDRVDAPSIWGSGLGTYWTFMRLALPQVICFGLHCRKALLTLVDEVGIHLVG